MDKLCAIHLFEADWNGLNKLVFARRMMAAANSSNAVPPEQFANTKSQAIDGVMTRTFADDKVRVYHYTTARASVDLGDCYDAVDHSVASIAMQAYHVPYKMVHMMLKVLQQMQYYLRTGFGQANVPFGSCPDDPCFGLGQGNGAAPPGFSAVSTLMINSYKSCNHGMQVLTPYSLLSFVLAAIL